MTPCCVLCQAPLPGPANAGGWKVLETSGPGAVPVLRDALQPSAGSGTEPTGGPAAAGGGLLYLCDGHVPVTSLLGELLPDPDDVERRVRGELYQQLDLLAFALEMEASAAVRQAQRRVGGVSAPEVDRRLDRWKAEYDARLPG